MTQFYSFSSDEALALGITEAVIIEYIRSSWNSGQNGEITLENFRDRFGWWSASTIQRALSGLIKLGVVIEKYELGTFTRKRTLYINERELDRQVDMDKTARSYK